MTDAARMAELARAFVALKDLPRVGQIARSLASNLARCDASFLGGALEDGVAAGRLPDGIGSAWIFVLRAGTRTLPHSHPNSVQHTIVLEGGGAALVEGRRVPLGVFQQVPPEAGILVIPADVDHAFDVGPQDLVVLSLHTVPAAELIEVEADSRTRRTYL